MKKYLLFTLLLSFSFLVIKAQFYYIDEDFNAGVLPAGWTNVAVTGTVAWKFGIDGSTGTNTNSTNGNQNFDGTPLVYFDDDTLGGNQKNNFARITTPVFNNASSSQSVLEFDYNFKSIAAINDSFYVEVFDGANWQKVFTRVTNDCGHYDVPAECPTGLPHANVDITAYGNANCQVRFVYFDGNDWGWFAGFDNVEIYSYYDADLTISELVSPISGCGMTAAETIGVKIKNTGALQSASNFPVSYQVGNNPAVTETVTATIPPGDSLVYNFTATANLSAMQPYDVRAYTAWTGDESNVNDTLDVVVENEPSYAPPYSNDFETANTDWEINGPDSTWQLGVPSAVDLTSAASGQNAFVTNLTGDYPGSQLSYIESPCFDFSAVTADPIMTFALYYNTEARFDNAWMEYSTDKGNTWTKLMGSSNALNWYNNTANNVWTGKSNVWLDVSNVLTNMAGEPTVKVRMVFNSDFANHEEGVGFDDFMIRVPEPIDLGVRELIYPSPSALPICGLSSQEKIIIEVENNGQNVVNEYNVFYRVNGGVRVSDTIRTPLPPNGSAMYTFNYLQNMSYLIDYDVKIWIEAVGDTYLPNDTLNKVIPNVNSPSAIFLPYVEDFESFNEGTRNMSLSWSNNNISTDNFTWAVSDGGATTGGATGPNFDHTTNSNGGTYLYAQSAAAGANPGNQALLSTPCLDLSRSENAYMSFWYHRYGADVGNLFIDVHDGREWNLNVDNVSGQTQTSSSDAWLRKDVNLKQFIGRRVKIRFRVIHDGTSGDVAIDDIRLYEPYDLDARLVDVTEPVLVGCGINEESVVSVDINNFGLQPIQPDSMFVYYQVDNQTPVRDTFRQNIAPEQTKSFTFTQTANLSNRGQKYNIKTWVALNGDPNPTNDTIQNYKVVNYTRTPGFVEDFETFRNALCDDIVGQVLENGWYASESNYAWHVQNSQCGKGDQTTHTAGTGPAGDHTLGDGVFLYTGNSTGPVNSDAELNSPCIDLRNVPSAKMSFWYHRYGSNMGSLTVKVSDGSGQNEASLVTITGTSQSDPYDSWSNQIVDLSGYVGDYAQIQFVGATSGGNMAIDDIQIYQPDSIDVGVVEVVSPNGDACNLPSAAQVRVRVKNFGSKVIPANTVQVRYTNNGEQLAIDTVAQSIPVDGMVSHTFSQTVDLNSSGGTQEIVASTVLTGDTAPYNNTAIHEVYNRSIGFPYYFQDFERMTIGANGYPGDDLMGWTRDPDGTGHTWHVWSGDAPTIDGEPMPNPPIDPNGPNGDHTYSTDRKNGNGTYMLVETKFRQPMPPASLITPCAPLNFRESKNGKVLLTFWYHMFGNVGDLFIDVFDGVSWQQGVGVINGSQQQKATDPWKFHSVSLENYDTVQNARIRFRSVILDSLGGGDIGIDDVTLLDRDSIDVAVREVTAPTSDCNMRNRERLEVTVQNTGVVDIYELTLAYQITFYPFQGGLPITMPIQRFTDPVGTIAPLATYSFEFSDPTTLIDMTQSGKYEIKVWTEDTLDSYSFNDTIVEVIENVTRPFPTCEDFSDLLLGQFPYAFEGETLPNNWVGSQGKGYSWGATKKGFTANVGGPFEGHTSGLNDIYLFAPPDPMQPPSAEAWVQTPCYDLTNTRAANLEFYYKAGSRDHRMRVQGRIAGGGAWRDIDTLQGLGFRNAEKWTKAVFVLADFIGNFVEFRLLANNVGYLAVDDFCVLPPPPQQIELEQILTPRQNLCFYSDEEQITFRAQNVGNDRIDSFKVTLEVDAEFPKSPRGQYQKNEFWIYPTVPAFEPGMKQDFTLDTVVDMSTYIGYFISITLDLPGDINPDNDAIFDYPIRHADPIDLPYIVDFENPNDRYGGMEGFNSAASIPPYTQTIAAGLHNPNQLYYNRTGPNADHTLQNNNGHYWIAESAGGVQGDAVTLLTQCIDFQNAQNPKLSYWYHRYSAYPVMGEFTVEANADNGWKVIDVLTGPDLDQVRHSSPWKRREVDLSEYAGDVVKFRFTSYHPGIERFGNHALDDINFYDLKPKDIAANSLIRPNDSIQSCYNDEQAVTVGVRNNGSDSLYFSDDTLNITVFIRKDGNPWDTLTQQVTEDAWWNPNTLLYEGLPQDSIARIEFDSTFDMSDIGSTFDFLIEAKMNGDAISSNDTTSASVLAKRDAGSITSISPNDTVCHQTQVRLELTNYFGSIQWRERPIDANGNGSWADALVFPTDRPQYAKNMNDSTTQFTVRICDAEEAVPVTVEVTRAFPGGPIHSSICYDEYAANDSNITTGVVVPSNIDEVRFLDSDTASLGRYLYTSERADSIAPSGNQFFYYTDRLQNFYDTAYNNDTFYVRTRIDSCWSVERTVLYASVNPMPSSYISGVPLGDTLCMDTAVRLNANGYEDRKYTYDWTIRYPEDSIQKDSVQTITVDAWRLENNETYEYEVIVTTDSGCVSPNPVTASITIVDSCVTSIQEYSFGSEFNIYPNPTSHDVYVVYQSTEVLQGNVKLLNMQGQVIYDRRRVNFTNTRTKFNMETLPKGIYFIKVETSKGNVIKKIIKS
jgi:hypothetical protein